MGGWCFDEDDWPSEKDPHASSSPPWLVAQAPLEEAVDTFQLPAGQTLGLWPREQPRSQAEPPRSGGGGCRSA